MTDRELMQQALEALENTTPTGFNMESDKRFYAAIAALRERLAKPEQEPVAWVWPTDWELSPEDAFSWVQTAHHTIPLYTAPPRREWVGLTEEEIKELCAANGWDSSWQSMLFARAIEAKLREKNHAQ